MSRRELIETQRERERLLVCGVLFPEQPPESDGPLSEVSALVDAAEARVIGTGIHQSRQRPHPGTLFGKGKVEEIGDEATRLDADGIVVDNDLTPVSYTHLTLPTICSV